MAQHPQPVGHVGGDPGRQAGKPFTQPGLEAVGPVVVKHAELLEDLREALHHDAAVAGQRDQAAVADLLAQRVVGQHDPQPAVDAALQVDAPAAQLRPAGGELACADQEGAGRAGLAALGVDQQVVARRLEQLQLHPPPLALGQRRLDRLVLPGGLVAPLVAPARIGQLQVPPHGSKEQLLAGDLDLGEIGPRVDAGPATRDEAFQQPGLTPAPPAVALAGGQDPPAACARRGWKPRCRQVTHAPHTRWR
jgi:hypothetical protein